MPKWKILEHGDRGGGWMKETAGREAKRVGLVYRVDCGWIRSHTALRGLSSRYEASASGWVGDGNLQPGTKAPYARSYPVKMVPVPCLPNCEGVVFSWNHSVYKIVFIGTYVKKTTSPLHHRCVRAFSLAVCEKSAHSHRFQSHEGRSLSPRWIDDFRDGVFQKTRCSQSGACPARAARYSGRELEGSIC